MTSFLEDYFYVKFGGRCTLGNSSVSISGHNLEAMHSHPLGGGGGERSLRNMPAGLAILEANFYKFNS